MKERPNFELVSSFLSDSEEEENIVKNVLEQAKQDIDATKNVETKKKTAFWISKLKEEAKRLGLSHDLLLDIADQNKNG